MKKAEAEEYSVAQCNIELVVGGGLTAGTITTGVGISFLFGLSFADRLPTSTAGQIAIAFAMAGMIAATPLVTIAYIEPAISRLATRTAEAILGKSAPRPKI